MRRHRFITIGFSMRNPTLQVLALSLSLVLAAHVRADNWPHWRGEAGNGVSSTAKPPTEFSESANLKWKVALPGRGSGSPVVWEDAVFVTTAKPAAGGSDGELDFDLLCLDRATGETKWQSTAVTGRPHEGTHSTNGYASASPCTDGTHVYAHFGSKGLYCFTMGGELVWKRDDFGQMTCRNQFGEGSSPTLDGDYIFLPWDHEGPSALYCLDKLTGKTVWKADRDEPTNWATPLIVEHAGNKQVIMNGQNFARSYDYATGKEIWRCGGQTDRPAASPVASDGRVFVGSGFRGAFLGAFDLAGSGDIAGSKHVQWSVNRDTPDIASLLLSENRLYFYKQKSGILSCVEASTGKPFYTSQRISELGNIYASPIAAAGHVYLSDRDGTLVVIKDAPQLEIVSVSELGETLDASPAPVDNQLILRGEQHVFCFEN